VSQWEILLLLAIVGMGIYPLWDRQKAMWKRLDRIDEKLSRIDERLSTLWSEHEQKRLSTELDAAMEKGKEIAGRLKREGFYSFDEDGREHWHPPGSEFPK
jgi:hypothetical protein